MEPVNIISLQGVQASASTISPVCGAPIPDRIRPVSYTHLRAHETVLDLVCRLRLEKKKITSTRSGLIT